MINDEFSKDALAARKDADAGFDFAFVFFWGHTPSEPAKTGPWVLSQWYPSPFTVGEESYATAEHFMMAEKARVFGDDDARSAILASTDPKEVKALGRRIRGFDNAVWEQEREAVVGRGSVEKFRQNAALRQYLESTGSAILVEASPSDAIWGIGAAAADPVARDPRRWPGLNLLGACLMRARATLLAAA